ncbi:MAG: alpha/beta fold hydrolase [Saccharospirillaceae bacterium]|nr:esterase family protein [Pseudomonadales bacterium]NRB79779.1 alpha/beta fold hydrolase [Saccharospirillaceae bacterium]
MINAFFRWSLVASLMLTFSLSYAENKFSLTTTIKAPSLAGSLLKNKEQQSLRVYLPKSYYTSSKRYPVLYYFHGYGANHSEVNKLMGYKVKKAIKSGDINEMIIVGINGNNQFGGSFYANSPVTGNWEDYVVNDVINFMDTNYRTINKAQYRGLAGFSMGGYAAINIAFKHPDKFKHIFALSPGLFDPTGLQQAVKQWQKEGWTDFMDGYAAAFAPNPKSSDDQFWFNWDDSNKLTTASWESGFGDITTKIKNYVKQTQKLDNIYIEYGSNDQFKWIVSGSKYLISELENNNIVVNSFDHYGSHSLGSTQALHIVSFFSEVFPN